MINEQCPSCARINLKIREWGFRRVMEKDDTKESATRTFKPKRGITGRQNTDLRIERSISLRKDKREAMLSERRQRRFHGNTTQRAHNHDASGHPDACSMRQGDQQDNGITPKSFQSLCYAFEIYVPRLSDPSASAEDRLQALSVLANCTDTMFSSKQIVDAGLRPDVIEFIAPYVQTGEASLQKFVLYAWSVLANLATLESGGDWCTPMFKHGIVKAARIHMQKNSSPEIIQRALWTVCNVVGKNGTLVRAFIEDEGIPAILRVFQAAYQTGNKALVALCMWFCHNVFQCKTAVPWKLVADLWPCIIESLKIPFEYDDDDVESLLSDALWATSYVSRRANIVGESMRQDEKLFHAIVNMVHIDHRFIQWPVMRLMGNLSESPDRELTRDMVLYRQPPQAEKNLFLARIRDTLCNSLYEEIRKEAAFFLTNVLADNVEFIPILMDDGIVNSICLRLTNGSFTESTNYLVEFLHTLVVKHGTQLPWMERDMVMRHLIERTPFMQSLSTHLQAMNDQCVYNLLEIVRASLEWRKESPSMQEMDIGICDVSGLLEDEYIFDTLDKLQTYGVPRVEELAAEISDTFAVDHEEMYDMDDGSDDDGFVGGGFAPRPMLDPLSGGSAAYGGGPSLYSF